MLIAKTCGKPSAVTRWPSAIADCRVVDHGVEAAERIDLGGDLLGAGDGLDVADHDRLRLRAVLAGRIGAARRCGHAGRLDDLG